MTSLIAFAIITANKPLVLMTSNLEKAALFELMFFCNVLLQFCSLYSSPVPKLPVGFCLRDTEEMSYMNEWNILRSTCLHIHTKEMSIRCQTQTLNPERNVKEGAVHGPCTFWSIAHLKRIHDHHHCFKRGDMQSQDDREIWGISRLHS